MGMAEPASEGLSRDAMRVRAGSRDGCLLANPERSSVPGSYFSAMEAPELLLVPGVAVCSLLGPGL